MVNNEVEIIKTVDIEKKDRIVRRLVNAGISYLEKWEKVPFFKRHAYNGSKEVCVIFVNDHQKEKAEEIVAQVEANVEDPGKHRFKIKALRDGEKKKGSGSSKEEEEFFDEED